MKMVNHAKEQTLFVGKERICRQVAYVLDIQDYTLTEKLTKRNFEQYRNYKIYVCEFKRKSRGLVNRKLQKEVTNIQYMEDICRSIDGKYYVNRERHKDDFKNFQESSNAKTSSINKKTTKSVAAETTITTVYPNVNIESTEIVHQPLWRRVMRGMKHPLRAAWHVVLRIKEKIKRQHCAGQEKTQHESLKKICKQSCKRNSEDLEKYLKKLKPSELLLYVLRAKPNKNIQCTRLETAMHIYEDGASRGCCSVLVPFGNLVYDGELDEIYHSSYARIVKLSSLNRSYCLCNLNTWCKGYCGKGAVMPTAQWATNAYPKSISLSFDKSCNLACQSCRSAHYVMNEVQQKQTANVVDKLVRSGYLEQSQSLTVAGMGEAFYSPYYRRLLKTEIKRNNINVLSNGTLFNEDNWQLLANKYNRINVDISVDAATAETYQKLRGADFENLMRNLNMLSDLRRQKQIHRLNLNFVVQRDNFREMPAFVKLGQSLGVDRIQFQRLNNFGNVATQEFLKRCMIINNEYLDYELWCVLQDPIFKDQFVDLQGLQRYIDASEHRYRKRYGLEQKGQFV